MIKNFSSSIIYLTRCSCEFYFEDCKLQTLQLKYLNIIPEFFLTKNIDIYVIAGNSLIAFGKMSILPANYLFINSYINVNKVEIFNANIFRFYIFCKLLLSYNV